MRITLQGPDARLVPRTDDVSSGRDMAMEVPPDPVVEAIRQLRDQIRCKPGKARQHLAKRIALGHLPPEATVADYDALIRRVVQTPTAEVFVYRWGEHTYPTVVAEIDGVRWLVMLGMDGIMETAFPPEDAAMSLASLRLTHVGTLEDLGV
jgi:hypothetical protein